MSGAGHGPAHGHDGPENKRVALLIAVLALVLAISETLSKSAQTTSLSRNVEASNLWSFFQAKTIRMTTLSTAAEQAELTLLETKDPNARQSIEQRIASWRNTAARYQSEPETGEGRQELATRAKNAEDLRDRSLAAYHHYELASGAVQIAIVLASSAIITGTMVLAWIAGGLGVLGIILTGIGSLAPTALHLF